jgi:hypothetical protein
MVCIHINSVFTIGYKCESSGFLDFLNIQKYSSPFSYMLIDINTSLYFIDTAFKTYTDKDYYIDTWRLPLKFFGGEWGCYHAHKVSDTLTEGTEISNLNRICAWNHHNITDYETSQRMNRRSRHLLHLLETSPETLLLFYIEKLQDYQKEKSIYFDVDVLKKYKCNFLILVPLRNLDREIFVAYDNNKIRVIYISIPVEGGEIPHNDVVKNKINELFIFDIKDRESEFCGSTQKS